MSLEINDNAPYPMGLFGQGLGNNVVAGITQITINGQTVTGNIIFGGSVVYNSNSKTFTFTGTGSGVTQVTSTNTDIEVINDTTAPELTLNSTVVGAPNKIVKLDSLGKFGAIDGGALTNLTKAQVGLSNVPNVNCTDPANLPIGSNTTKGIVQADGTTTTIANGVISAISGGSGGATGLIVASSDNSIIQNGLSSYNPNTRQITINLSAKGGASAGVNSVNQINGNLVQVDNTDPANPIVKLASSGVLPALDSGTNTTVNAKSGYSGALNTVLLNIINAIPAPYTLPASSTTQLGGVKVDGSSIVINSDNVISATASGGGTVTSVGIDGGTTGLTAQNSPITTHGVITLNGTLAVSHGGTGATTPLLARTNLGIGDLATQYSNNVNITGGTASFSHASVVNAPINANDITNKAYVDSKVVSGVSQAEFDNFSTLTNDQIDSLYAQSNLLIGAPIQLADVQDWLDTASQAMRTVVMTFASQTITFVATRANCNSFTEFASFIQSQTITLSGVNSFTCIYLPSPTDVNVGKLILTSNTSVQANQILYPNAGAGTGFDEQIKITQNTGAILRINSTFATSFVTYVDARSMGGTNLTTASTIAYQDTKGIGTILPGCLIEDGITTGIPLNYDLAQNQPINVLFKATLANTSGSAINVSGLTYTLFLLATAGTMSEGGAPQMKQMAQLTNQSINIPARSFAQYTLANFVNVRASQNSGSVLLLQINGGSGFGVKVVAFVNQLVISITTN